MLETSEERIRLLKAGINCKTIEKLYVIYNGFKLIGGPVLFEPVRIGNQDNEDMGREGSADLHKIYMC